MGTPTEAEREQDGVRLIVSSGMTEEQVLTALAALQERVRGMDEDDVLGYCWDPRRPWEK